MPAAVFLGAGLLFLVQPVLARFVLPWFGGAPAVWTTCLLFFQAALLLGYGYAHWLHRLGRRGVHLHLGLLCASLLLMPVTPDASWKPSGDEWPTARLLALLASTAGVPYVLLAATAPLVQAQAAARSDARPYRLYAWSNAGSLIALAAHPLLLEPALGARAQTLAWSAGYGVFAALLWWALRGAVDAPRGPARAPRHRDRALWFGLSACGSALLLAVSDAIAEDLSVTPLLWVLPLSLYLLSFVVAFAGDRWTARALTGPGLVVALGLLWWVLHLGYKVGWALQLGAWSGALFVACLALHGELARARPGPSHLTGYYLWLSAGGAFGGLVVAVVAPLLVPQRLELHGILLCAWLLYGVAWLRGGLPAFGAREGRVALVVAGGLLLSGALGYDAWRRIRGAEVLTRSFFGVLKVKEYGEGERRVRHLLDGRISHGFQYLDEARRGEPTAYFHRHSGVGEVLGAPAGPRRVGVLGLGVGTLASYARPGDAWRFYEINPDVVRVARSAFSYLEDAAASVEVVVGDARLALEREAPQGFDVLVVDAFSGDAIPTHLLTDEAMRLYLRHLAPEGVLAINVSNRHAELPRVVVEHARRLGLGVVSRRTSERYPTLGWYRAHWLLLAARPLVGEAPEGEPVEWTDDFAPVLPILR